MSSASIQFSVFTKPWKNPLPELAKKIQAWGFTGIEFPIRPGFQVVPERAAQDLPEAIRILGEHGIKITSVATNPSDEMIALCAENNIPLIRTMAEIGPEGYNVSVKRLQDQYASLLPALEKHKVVLGVQNHYGNFVCNAMGLRDLLSPFDSPYIGAVWDPSHNAMCGEEPEYAIDIIWSDLRMVNLKNVFMKRQNGPEAQEACWKPYWTSGRQGLASWPRVVAELKRRNYSGVICLTAEYSDEEDVDRLIAEDIVYAKSLFS